MKIYNSLKCIQSELKCAKTLFNKFGGYHYRSAETILESLKPLLAKHSCIITINDSVEMIGDRFYIKAIAKLTNVEDGSSIETSAYAREELTKKGQDASQVTGATSSYARKYALNGLFCIDDTKDSDATNDGSYNAEPAKKTAKAQPKANDDGTDITSMAYADISRATTIEQLSGIFNDYPSLQKEPNFINALSAKKAAIKNGL